MLGEWLDKKEPPAPKGEEEKKACPDIITGSKQIGNEPNSFPNYGLGVINNNTNISYPPLGVRGH